MQDRYNHHFFCTNCGDEWCSNHSEKESILLDCECGEFVKSDWITDNLEEDTND